MDFKLIVVLTGAGISAESGIPVFRSETGLWEQERIEDVCVPEALYRNPKKVHDFYNKLRRNLKDKVPNAAHLALTRLQEEWEKRGGTVTLVTQNVDDLHEKALSHDVIHMHGALRSIWCPRCDKRFPFEGDSAPGDVCPACGAPDLRPDIVFFGEMPYSMGSIESALRQCSLFISIGTSGVVYPAAGFVQVARSVKAHSVEFNLTPSATVSAFDKGIYGKASQTVPEFVESLLKGSYDPRSEN